MVLIMRLSVCPSVHLSVCPSVRLSVCPSVRLSVRRSVRLFVCSFVRPSVRPSVRLSVCLRLSVRPSVRHFVRSVRLPFVCVIVLSLCCRCVVLVCRVSWPPFSWNLLKTEECRLKTKERLNERLKASTIQTKERTNEGQTKQRRNE